jgi:formate--tetrahydrofolate ligase
MIYGADGVDYEHEAMTDLELINKHHYDNLPVCVAKTPKSLSDKPLLLGRPRNFRITVNELRIFAGAGFIVAICGNIMTMPGLPKVPAATRIKVLPDGRAVGLS